MKNKLLFIADLGSFKAYHIIHDRTYSRPRISFLEKLVPADSDKQMERFTDQSGQVRGSVRKETGSDGEQHNIQIEAEKRIVRQFAQRVNQIAHKESERLSIYLAAHKEILHQIIEHLDRNVRAHLVKILPEDLTRLPESQLLEHFDHAEELAGVGG